MLRKKKSAHKISADSVKIGSVSAGLTSPCWCKKNRDGHREDDLNRWIPYTSIVQHPQHISVLFRWSPLGYISWKLKEQGLGLSVPHLRL